MTNMLANKRNENVINKESENRKDCGKRRYSHNVMHKAVETRKKQRKTSLFSVDNAVENVERSN